ncbi:MAG: hypothetical protein RR769_04600 [Anaerovoracaceae bacterium]
MRRTHTSRFMAVMLAVVMVMSVTFAMTTTAFATTGNPITVTVKLDTRSYNKNAVLVNNNNVGLGGTQVTYSNVTVPLGSNVWNVIQKVATDNNFQLQYKTVPDYTNPTITHYAVQDIANVGENHIVEAGRDAFITMPDSTDSRGYYYVSGWVFGLTPANGIEYFPSNYMDATEVTNGMTVTLHYSVTGCYDINTSNWTPDYSYPDVTMWNLYDQIAEKIAVNPGSEVATSAKAVLDFIFAEIEASATAVGNTTGLSAYYFSHNGLTNTTDYQFISALKDTLATFV